MTLQMRRPHQTIMRSAWQKEWCKLTNYELREEWKSGECERNDKTGQRRKRLCAWCSLTVRDMFPWFCALTHWEALNLPEQTGDRSVLSHRDFCIFNPFLLWRPATRLHNFTGHLWRKKKSCISILLHTPVGALGQYCLEFLDCHYAPKLFSESYNFLTSCCVLHGYDVMLRR